MNGRNYGGNWLDAEDERSRGRDDITDSELVGREARKTGWWVLPALSGEQDQALGWSRASIEGFNRAGSRPRRRRDTDDCPCSRLGRSSSYHFCSGVLSRISCKIMMPHV